MKQTVIDYLIQAKKIYSLALPLIAVQISYMSMQVVDTLMMGQLGPVALATGALGGVIIYNTLVFFVGITSAVGTKMSQAYGAKAFDQVTDYLFQGIFLSLLLSMFGIFIVINLPRFLTHFSFDKKLLDLTRTFLITLSWGIPAWLLFFIFRDFVAICHKTKIILIISIFAVPLNACFNYIFMYGKFGMPSLGIAGIGYATSLVRWFMLLALISYIYYKKWFHTVLEFKGRIVKSAFIISILRLGYPVGLMMGLEIGMFTVITLAMGYFGIIALSAHQIAIQCANVVFTIPLGISQAVNIRVGYAIGAKKYPIIKQSIISALIISSFASLIIALIFYLLPIEITHLFLNDLQMNNTAIKIFATSFLFMAAILQFLDSAQIIMLGSLRGLNDTFIPMVYGVLAYWVIGLSSAYLLAFVYQFKEIGLWWGLCAGIGVSTFLLVIRFQQLKIS